MLISKGLKYRMQSGSVMPKVLFILIKMALAFVGHLWFHTDGINDGDGMWAPTDFRVNDVGSQDMVIPYLVFSSVDGVADSIVGSSKFKGVCGLSFYSWVCNVKTNVSLKLETYSGTPVVQSLSSLCWIHLHRKARHWTIHSVVVFSNQKLEDMFPGVSVLLINVDIALFSCKQVGKC